MSAGVHCVHSADGTRCSQSVVSGAGLEDDSEATESSFVGMAIARASAYPQHGNENQRDPGRAER